MTAVIVDQVEVPIYLRIADKARHLRELGMSHKAIARALGVSDKTAAKAISAANGVSRDGRWKNKYSEGGVVRS